LYVNWMNGLERVLSIRHYGETCYLGVTRERRENGCPFEVRIGSLDAFDVHPDPSSPALKRLYHVWHKGEMLTLFVGYHSGIGRNRVRPDSIQIRLESGPEWKFCPLAVTDYDWPDWDRLEDRIPQPKESDDDDDDYADDERRSAVR
jgi:hypothetical protein